MHRRLSAWLALLAAASLAGGAVSGSEMRPHLTDDSAGHASHGAPAAEAPHLVALREASDRMHAAMDVSPSGDPDADFVRGMIGHHAGAIEMARVVLEHGSDPEIRALAEKIMSAQQREIETMQHWLERHEQ